MKLLLVSILSTALARLNLGPESLSLWIFPCGLWCRMGDASVPAARSAPLILIWLFHPCANPWLQWDGEMEECVREKSGGMMGRRALCFSLNGHCWPYSPAAFCSARIFSHCSWCYPKQCLFSESEWWEEKRQSWSLLFRLPASSPEFIPENYIFKWNVGLAALYSFIHLYIQQPVMECLAYARHCARLWGYDIELEAGVYKLLWEMENSQ